MDRYPAPLPSWKKDLLLKRQEQLLYSKRTTDVLEDRLPADKPAVQTPALKSPTKTADIIKFFNTVADGDHSGTSSTSGRYPGPAPHLASSPGIKVDEEGVPRVPDRPASYPTRHGAAHLHRFSSLQAAQQLPVPAPQHTTFNVEFTEDTVSEDGDSVIQCDEEEDESRSVSSSSSGEVSRFGASAGLTVGSRPMGEDKRLFLSNGRSEVESRGLAGVGSKLHRSRQQGKRNVGRGSAGGGDSDGMMGSGGDSDSSEEIHYGPGFVSRLKSRYMSVALRGSARGSLGNLRRTASLEDFLDLERSKQMQVVEQEDIRAPLHRIQTNRVNFAVTTNQPSKVQIEMLNALFSQKE